MKFSKKKSNAILNFFTYQPNVIDAVKYGSEIILGHVFGLVVE